MAARTSAERSKQLRVGTWRRLDLTACHLQLRPPSLTPQEDQHGAVCFSHESETIFFCHSCNCNQNLHPK